MTFPRITVMHIGPPGNRHRVRLRCPFCRVAGTLDEGVGNDQEVVTGGGGSVWVGNRNCPNPDCRAHIFVAYDADGNIIVTYPPEVIDFDSTNLPERVLGALREAILCHANKCYIAAAMMVRKTLEELCADRGATGDNLKQRIEALGETIVLPAELFEGLDDLRLLGNDAAHIESRVFDEIGQEEVEVGIEFTKEVLKAAYQHAELLARLRALRRDQPSEGSESA